MQAVTLRAAERIWISLRDLAVLGKAGITTFVVLTAALGYWMAGGEVPSLPFWGALLGTVLVTAGAGALNQYVERDADAQMERTRHRPLPAGRIPPAWGLAYGVGLSVLGSVLLGMVGSRPLVWALIAWLTYVFIYTPVKRVTWLCNVPGAIAGAIPPLIGWSAASDRIGPGGWLLFALLWLWQWPHLMTIAWMYRDDIRRAGFVLLPAHEDRVPTLLATLTLGLGLLGTFPFWLGMTGPLYLPVAGILGLWLTGTGLRFARRPTWTTARQFFGTALAYLLLLCLAMIVTRT